VGRPIDLAKASGLNYDSDEDKDGSNELISLDNVGSSRDRTGTAAEKVPKLRKPK